jgi:hypothetical protein
MSRASFLRLRVAAAVTVSAALFLAVSCASVGTGDPTLVRAEDLLSNSLAIYDGAMRYHFANSTKETPQVYRIMESVRTGFPPAWKALYDGTRAYKTSPASTDLAKLMAAIQTMLDELSGVSMTSLLLPRGDVWIEALPVGAGG